MSRSAPATAPAAAPTTFRFPDGGGGGSGGEQYTPSFPAEDGKTSENVVDDFIALIMPVRLAIRVKKKAKLHFMRVVHNSFQRL